MSITLACLDALADALDIAAAYAATIAADARVRADEPGAREYACERLRCLVDSIEGMIAHCRAVEPAHGMVAAERDGAG